MRTDRSIANQNINFAEVTEPLIDHAEDLLSIRHIGQYRERLHIECLTLS